MILHIIIIITYLSVKNYIRGRQQNTVIINLQLGNILVFSLIFFFTIFYFKPIIIYYYE